MRFDEYMERCLYDPEGGFYASARGIAGRRGDFITSPEVGPLFGAVLARALDQWWDELGRPDPFPVIDLGTGPGTLLRSLTLAAPRCSKAWELIGVDRANNITLPPVLENGIVIANELLDNMPFRIVRRIESGWEEVEVTDDGERWIPLDTDPDLDVPTGKPAPLLTEAVQLVENVLARRPSRLVAFDYGTATTGELADRGGWLRTYRNHERGDDPYDRPGSWDITTDIAVDQLPPPTSVISQSDFLVKHGIGELVAEGRAHWIEHAARPDLLAMRMRSRVSEAEALLDPDGLGSWLCMQWQGPAESSVQ